MKTLLCFVIFIYLAFADFDDDRDFPLLADANRLYVIPIFTSNSTMQDFMDTYFFLFKLPYLKSMLMFDIYIKEDSCSCFSTIGDDVPTCSMLGSSREGIVFNDTILMETLYNNSITSDPDTFLKTAFSSFKDFTTVCSSNDHNCYVKKYNFIILTNLNYFPYYPDNYQYIFYALSSSLNPPSYYKTGFFYVNNRNVSITLVDEIISNNTLTYSFDPTTNLFNVFIVGDQSIIEDSVNLAENLIINGNSSFTQLDDPYPRFYVAAIKKNDTFCYQGASVRLGSRNINKVSSVNMFPQHKTKFNFITPNRRGIWLIVGIAAAAVLIVLFILTFLIWRYRINKRLKEKYLWAMKSGITPKEADTFVTKGKELFVNEKTLKVDYNKIIGKGVSSIVYEGYLTGASPITSLNPCMETANFGNCKVAVKIANSVSKDEFEQVFREIEATQKIGYHRHICCLLGWTIYQQTPSLIFEFIDGQDLFSWAKNDSDQQQKSDKIIAQILWQISDAMNYIASKGVVHKDLAARNVLLLNSRLEVKLIDFGLSSISDESFTYQAPFQRRLPIRWMAIETLTERLFSEASDVWSFGILMWEIFNQGKIPYGALDGNDILNFLNEGNRLEISENVTEEFKDLMKECWKEDREKRPSFEQIKNKMELYLEKQTINYGYIIFEEEEMKE